jgi:hypothetical protein
MALWDDHGEVSQGKIITAILKGREPAARMLLRRWTERDLRTLSRAAERLMVLVDHEITRRERHA